MARFRIQIEIDVKGPDAADGGDAVDDALDAGGIQDAIEDAKEVKGLDFTIESATVTHVTRIGR
jgi:hypothetical protein